MRKFVVFLGCIFMIFSAFGVGENIPTSKSYVDAEIATKQDKITANDGTPQVLTNTGTSGEYGTKGIYDSTNSYATQTDALIDAVTMNTAVQNAIDSEFQCVEWANPNDHTSECLLMDVRGETGQSVLPTGYTALEYIESTGTQYIDTGIKGNLNTKAILDFQIHNYSDNGYILGGRTGQNANAFIIGSNSGLMKNNTYPFAQFDTIQPRQVVRPANFDLNRHIYELSSNGFYIDGTLYTRFPNPTSFTTQENITLFGRYSSGEFKLGNFMSYGLKLYEGGNLIRNFIPARRDSDSEIGMYDMVSGTFFTNAGSGEFIAGPVVNLYLPSGN
ncbi:MAG: hypothetical protein J5620_01155 [Alphaproteobacteria bacterium]|nr:hypothetical protein [Alphaproteobacteria bacterium]